MLIPGIIAVLIYSYGPMFGLVMAFQQYNPVKGFLGSKWIGLDNFRYIFAMPGFVQALLNTLYISALKILFGLAVPLVLALMINELVHKRFGKLLQSSMFFPYLLSWAVVAGIVLEIFSLNGPINSIVSALGGTPTKFMLSNQWFPGVLVSTEVWKNMGANLVIFGAAIIGVDPTLYEAADVDGAGKLRQVFSITLPTIAPIVILISILSIGNLLNAGLEQVLLLYNPIVYRSGDIIDTFVYRVGIFNQEYGPAAAIGLFKSVVTCLFVSISYFVAYKTVNYRIF